MTGQPAPYAGGKAARIVVRALFPVLALAAAETMFLSFLLIEDRRAVYGVILSVLAVFLAQLVSAGYTASRIAPRVFEAEQHGPEAVGDLLKSFPFYVTAHLAAAAVLFGPIAFITASGALGLGPAGLLESSGIICFAIQALLLFPVWGMSRFGFQNWMIAQNIVHREPTHFRSFFVLLLPIAAIPAVMTAIGLSVAGELVVEKTGQRLMLDSYRRAAEAALVDLPETARPTALYELTGFDAAAPFTYRPETGDLWGIDSADLRFLERVEATKASGAAVGPAGRTALVWIPLGGAGAIGGFKVTLDRAPLAAAYQQLCVLLAALLGSLLVAILYGASITRHLAQALSAVRSLPDRDIPETALKMPREIEAIRADLRTLRSRFKVMRTTEKKAIEGGLSARVMKAQFFAGISHELRSPLNSVIGFTDLLLKGLEGSLTFEQRQAVLKIAEESEKLMVLIADILDSAKVDAGTFDVDRDRVPAADLLNECASEAKRLIGTRPISLETAFDAGLPTVHIDKARIRQALISLLARAMSAMHEGALGLNASVEGPASGGGAIFRIDIVDLAGVLSKEEIARILAAFHSVDGTPSYTGSGGLGLGIALAREVVRRHGGELAVVAKPGKGPIFSMMLPLDSASDAK